MKNAERKLTESPAISDLLASHLKRRLEAHQAGFETGQAYDEVIPFEAIPAQPPDPRTAWTETLAVLVYLAPKLDTKRIRVPEEWTDLIARREPVMALPFAIGNYPQAVRNLAPLLQTSDLSTLHTRESSAETPVTTGPNEGDPEFPDVFIAIAVHRAAKQFNHAEHRLNAIRSSVPATLREVFSNEEAALAWHMGQTSRATDLWASISDSVPALFNRGMAALFTSRPADACANLSRAANQLSEDSGWHHLAKLYLAIAEMRRG